MNDAWNKTTAMPVDGSMVIAHVWCDFVVGWFYDTKDGVDYDEYVATFEPDDDDDHPVSRENYDYRRYEVVGLFSSSKNVFWDDVIEWLPLPDVDYIR